MARSFFSSTLALTAATLLLVYAGAMPAFAQPMPPATPSAEPKPKQYPEAQEALQRLLDAKHEIGWSSGPLSSERRYPELPPAHVLMYQILSQLPQQQTAARSELEVAIRVTPADPEPYIILGDIALQERRVAEAALDFDKAKQLLAVYANAEHKGALERQMMSGIVQVAETNQDWKAAESHLRDLLKLSREDLVAHQRLARSLFGQGKAVDAYEVLKKAKQTDRDNAKMNGTQEVILTPEAIMAQYYEQFEGPKSVTAETWFKAALKTAPDDLPTRQVVALWALAKGKIAFAKEQAENALRIEAADPKKYSRSNVGSMLRGLVALWEKDWSTAENYFLKIVLENPNDFVARNNLALALAEQDNPDKKQRALDYAEANFRDKNNNSNALPTLGWVYFRNSEFDQAALALEQAIKATNGNPSADTATYWAHVLYHLDQKWRAKEILENILKGDRPFSMRPEAQRLYEKVKDAQKPAAAPAKTP